MAKPGRSHREGITLMQLGEMFPDEAAAHEWFETIVWPNGRTCPRCRGDNTYRGTHKTMPYRLPTLQTVLQRAHRNSHAIQ